VHGLVRFSTRPVGGKYFQAIHRFSVNVAHRLVLLFGIGTMAVPSWDPRTRRNNLLGGLAVTRTIGMDARGKVIMRQQLSRGRLERHMANLQPCLVEVEASAGADG
jgi:hypothetical protein